MSSLQFLKNRNYGTFDEQMLKNKKSYVPRRVR